MSLTIELRPAHEQAEFNLARWRQIMADPVIGRLPHAIETDRHGRILMSPPPGPRHANLQIKIGILLERLLPVGGQLGDCAVSTSDGIKGVDVAWLAPDRCHELSSDEPLRRAPDICVEILSPSNAVREIEEKIDLYFEAGAREVWVCDRQGQLSFHVGSRSDRRANSAICPEFPTKIPGSPGV
jgi:Uma2 family endonuclease